MKAVVPLSISYVMAGHETRGIVGEETDLGHRELGMGTN